MMQPGGGGMAAAPMDHQHRQQIPQQWGMVAPPPPPQMSQQPYLQPHPSAPQPPMWGHQPSQIPPPVLQAPPMGPPPPQQQQQQMAQHYGGGPPTSAVQQGYGGHVAPQHPSSSDEIRSLWIGDLQYWMDETYLANCFGPTGEYISSKVIRNKQTGQSEGYGFVEFTSRSAAERVLQQYNGQMMPNIEQAFRLNWASLGSGERRDDSADYTIFVGDLAADVTDYMLQETFKAHYTSIKGAKVVTDRVTGRSKGYGFVRFGDLNEQNRAMTEMNGMYCSTRPMRIGAAASKKNAGAPQQFSSKAPYQTGPESENDPNNTTIFVGGLDTNVSEELLQQTFNKYGELVHVKIPVGKRCGFVQFANRANAEEALLMLNGTQLGGQNIRLSWGRSPSNKQPQADSSQWNGSYYGYAQGYDTYGYAAPPQDPNMYAYPTYPGYGSYPQQQ